MPSLCMVSATTTTRNLGHLLDEQDFARPTVTLFRMCAVYFLLFIRLPRQADTDISSRYRRYTPLQGGPPPAPARFQSSGSKLSSGRALLYLFSTNSLIMSNLYTVSTPTTWRHGPPPEPARFHDAGDNPDQDVRCFNIYPMSSSTTSNFVQSRRWPVGDLGHIPNPLREDNFTLCGRLRMCAVLSFTYVLFIPPARVLFPREDTGDKSKTWATSRLSSRIPQFWPQTPPFFGYAPSINYNSLHHLDHAGTEQISRQILLRDMGGPKTIFFFTSLDFSATILFLGYLLWKGF